jgi:RNA 3'-terminal phosphate cyclase (ATP)
MRHRWHLKGPYPKSRISSPTKASTNSFQGSRHPVMSSDTNVTKQLPVDPQSTVIRNVGSSTTPMITLDGSYGEGGGQVIRNACSYASIFHQNLHLTNIRLARRPKPGLRPQHVVGLLMLADACGGQVVDAAAASRHGDSTDMTAAVVSNIVGSNEIFFLGATKETASSPDSALQQVVGDTKTAGSICLLLQAVLPYALFFNQGCYKLILKGGTNASMAPPIDYFQHVFVPTLVESCRGISLLSSRTIQTNITTRGFYPKGGGHVEVTVQSPTSINDQKKPWKLFPINRTERGEVTEIVIHAFSAGTCHSSMAHRLAATATKHLQEYVTDTASQAKISMDVTHYKNAVGGGCGILLVAKTSTGCLLGASGVGSHKVPLPQTARQAAIELVDILRSGACVDDYLQDQLVLYMALADGISEMITNGVTLHTQTAIWVAEHLCEGVRFEVTALSKEESSSIREGVGREASGLARDSHSEGKVPGLHLIRCHGIGFAPSAMDRET